MSRPQVMTFKAYQAAMAKNETEGGLSYEGYMKYAKGRGTPYMSPGDYKKAADEEDEDDMDKGPVSGSARGILEHQSGTAQGDQGQRGILKAEQLLKAIGDYEVVEAAATAGELDRESVLKAKLDEGVITKAEQQELGQLWAGLTDPVAQGHEPLRKSIDQLIDDDDDPDAAEMRDASPFLKSLTASINDTLSAVRDDVLRDGTTTRTLLRGQGALIKSMGHVMAEQEELIKSQGEIIGALGARLGVLERQPVVRKSQGSDPRDVRGRQLGGGSIGGESGGASNKLSKAQVFQGMEALLQKASDARDEAAMDKLIHGISMFESTGQIDRRVLAAVHAHYANN